MFASFFLLIKVCTFICCGQSRGAQLFSSNLSIAAMIIFRFCYLTTFQLIYFPRGKNIIVFQKQEVDNEKLRDKICNFYTTTLLGQIRRLTIFFAKSQCALLDSDIFRIMNKKIGANPNYFRKQSSLSSFLLT